MSAISSDDIARHWARRLEDSEAKRFRLTLADARKSLAERIGVAAGTLENLSRQRVKGVRQVIYARLRSAVIKELQHEIAAHTHELTVLLATDRGSDLGAIAEVEAGLERMRALMSAMAPD